MKKPPPLGPNAFESHHAFFVCERIGQEGWLPYHQIRLPIDDLGFRQSVTAVERLRTYSRKPFLMDEHWTRLHQTLELIGIGGSVAAGIAPANDHLLSREALSERVQELFDRNGELVDSEGEIGITVWVTPGDRVGARPSMAVHLNRIDPQLVRSRLQHGQPVVLTDVVQPDEASWPRRAKVRCRLHYFLADAAARQAAADATGVLKDTDGSWTESGIANLGLVIDNEIFLGPQDRALPGITQGHLISISASLGISVRRRPLTTEMIRRAETVILTGTDSGIWFANAVYQSSDGAAAMIREFDRPEPNGVLRRLQNAMPSGQ